MKIEAPGAVLELFGDPLGGLGVSGGAPLDFWRDLAEIFGEVGGEDGEDQSALGLWDFRGRS